MSISDKIFLPVATGTDANGGWKLDFKFLEGVQDYLSEYHNLTLEEIEDVLLAFQSYNNGDRLKDRCEVCHGEKGGVRGNENNVNGVIMCDYCHAESLK